MGRVSEGAMLTVDDFWRLIGPDKITKQAVYLAVGRGEVPSVRLGKRILIPKFAAQEFLKGKAAPSAA
jgi:hypothetical protein